MTSKEKGAKDSAQSTTSSKKTTTRGRRAKPARSSTKSDSSSKANRTVSRQRDRQIVVLGMHRSGTSALTGALAGMGVHVGDDEELTPKSWENPRGFFERRDARKICDTLLHQSGADWWKISSFHPDNANFESLVTQRAAIRQLVEQLDKHGTWALKEPRLCFLLPIFLSALRDPLAIIAFRHPVESARSLRRRNGFPMQAGLALWEAYTTSLLRTGLAMDHVFVDFHAMIDDPETTLTALAGQLQSLGVKSLDVIRGIETIQPNLRRERFDEQEDSALLSPAQAALWEELSGARAWKSPPALSRSALTVLREFEADEAARLEARNSIKTLSAKVVALESQRTNVEKAEEAVRQAAAMSQQLEQIKKEHAARGDEVDALRGQLATSDARAAEQQRTIDGLRSELEELTERHAADARQAELLRTERTAREARLAELQAAESELRSRYAEQSERLAAQSSVVGELRGELAARQSQRLEEQAALGELRGRNAETVNALADARREIETLRSEVAIKETRNSELSLKMAVRQDQQALVDEQKQQIDALKKEAEQRRVAVSERDAEVSELRTTLESIIQLNEDQTRLAVEERQRAESLGEQVLERDARIAELVAALRDSESKQREQLAMDARKIETLQHELAARVAEVSKSGSELEAARRDTKSLRAALAAESSKADSFDKERKALRDRLLEADRELGVERQMRKTVEATSARQRLRSRQQHERAAALKATVHSLTAEKEQLEESLRSIEASRSWRFTSAIRRLRQRMRLGRFSRRTEASSRSEALSSRGRSDKSATEPGTQALKRNSGASPLKNGKQHASTTTGERTGNYVPVTPAGNRRDAGQADQSVSNGSRSDSRQNGVSEGEVREIALEVTPAEDIEPRKQVSSETRDETHDLRATDAATNDECKPIAKELPAESKKRPLQSSAARHYSVSEEELLERIRCYKSQKSGRKSRVVVYTAIIGGYDPLIVPELIVDDWDYVVFSDQPIKGEHVFEVRRPDYWNADPTRIARHIKMHPHVHFPEYEIAIWVDSNILMRGQHLVDSVKIFEKQGALLMSNPHPDRGCTYDELAKCLELGKDEPAPMKAQVERYRTEGLPAQYGMLETNILIRRHNDPRVRNFQALWWKEISEGSRRDQLSVMYSLWKLGLEHHVLPEMKDIRDHSENPYCLFPHKDKVSRKIPPYVAPGFMKESVTQAVASDLEGLRARKVRRVKLRLELGLTERALTELHVLSESDEPAVRRASSWELALWHAGRADETHAKQAIRYLKVVVEGMEDIAVLRRAAIVEAECWQTLGSTANARRALETAQNRAAHVDLLLGRVNLEEEPSRRLELINEALTRTGLSKIHCSGNEDTAVFDRLAASADAGDLSQDAKVTVIVPAYNSEATIGTALDSVLAQTWTNLEVIVVDDCSTDRTAAVVKERQLQDPRVRLLKAPINRGPYVARNLALERATGEFVTCNDADDWSHPEKIAVQLRELLRRKDLIATVSGWARCTEDLTFSRRGNPGNYTQLNISSLMFRRKPVVEALGCWDNIRFGADTEFFIRLKAAFGHEAVLEMPLAVLSLGRLTAGSLTGDSAFGYPGYAMGARRAYREAYSAHHDTSADRFYPALADQRPFPVPEPMWPVREAVGGVRDFDILIAVDLRNVQSTSLVQDDIRALSARGYKIALLNLPAYDFEPVSARANDEIRNLVDGDRVQVVVYGERIASRIAVVVDPSILRDRQDYLAEIDAFAVHAVLPAQADIGGLSEDCAENMERYFGHRGVWHCATADLMRSLESSTLGSGLTTGDRPWEGLRKVLDLPGADEYQSPQRSRTRLGDDEWDASVKVLDVKDIGKFSYSNPNGVAVIMPCIDVEKGSATAEVLVRRAEMPCLVLVVNDSIRQGFIKTLNAAAAQLKVRYVVYLAEDAFPGRGWLRRAYQALEDSGKGLLGFNDGKWDGRIASFGMVRCSWVRQLYGDYLLNPDYLAHKADNEITVIARAANQYEYRPDCTLVEVDPRKDTGGSNRRDDEVFAQRMHQGFGGVIARSSARALAKTYKVKWREESSARTDDLGSYRRDDAVVQLMPASGDQGQATMTGQ